MKFRSRSGLSILGVVLLFCALQPVCGAGERPAATVLEGVAFVDKTATLAAGSDAALQALLEELKADPSVSIVIKCAVRASGDEQQDAKLSRDRAQTLQRWLMQRGIAFYRLEIAELQTSTPAPGLPAAAGRSGQGRIEIVRIQKAFPAAQVPERAFRFEPVVDGQEILHDFQLFNEGAAPLNISKVRTG